MNHKPKFEEFEILTGEQVIGQRRQISILTSDIVQNLEFLVKKHNDEKPHCDRGFYSYVYFMKYRKKRLAESGNYAKLLRDTYFCEELKKVLKDFGMGQRGSKFSSLSQFQNTLVKASTDFDLLSLAEIRLETLDLKQEIENETTYSVIKRIYKLFSYPGNLSNSGGVVIASKTMHMIMPELFIMIDSYVANTLNKIFDYNPHPEDGESWYAIIPNYDGLKLNRKDTESWDINRYIAALIYYKRILREWCEKNNSDIQGFLNLDAQYNSTIPRIIDKALWWENIEKLLQTENKT